MGQTLKPQSWPVTCAHRRVLNLPVPWFSICIKWRVMITCVHTRKALGSEAGCRNCQVAGFLLVVLVSLQQPTRRSLPRPCHLSTSSPPLAPLSVPGACLLSCNTANLVLGPTSGLFWSEPSAQSHCSLLHLRPLRATLSPLLSLVRSSPFKVIVCTLRCVSPPVGWPTYLRSPNMFPGVALKAQVLQGP